MSATEQLAQNLQETADFLHVQKSVLDQPTWKMVVEQQTSVMLRRLELLNTLSPGEATAVVKLVTESKLGEIDPQWRSKAVLAVGARVSHGGKATSAARPKQAMSNWSSYLSVKDVELLQSANLSNYAKLDVVANRMVRIGLDLPTESSAGHILKLLGFVFSEGFTSHKCEPCFGPAVSQGSHVRAMSRPWIISHCEH